MQSIVPHNSLAVTQAAVAAARPTLVTEGVSCAGWYTGSGGPGRVSIVFDGDAARTIADPTGGTAGVEVWGYETGQWALAAYLNGGTDIPIAGATQGFVATVDLGRPFDRLYVAGTPSGGTISAKFVPLEVQG